jgi:hypothetical protein
LKKHPEILIKNLAFLCTYIFNTALKSLYSEKNHNPLIILSASIYIWLIYL